MDSRTWLWLPYIQVVPDFSDRPVNSVLTHSRVNKDGKFVYIKYHFLAETGQKQLTGPEAIRISGEDPDYSKKQLWDAIEEGKEIVWKAHVQIMEPDEADANKLGFDPFDVTKVWPRSQFPVFHRKPTDLGSSDIIRCTSLGD